MTLREKRRVWRNNWRKAHPEKWLECCQKYVSKNRQKIADYEKSEDRKQQKRTYRRDRRKSDVLFRIAGNLRARRGESIRKGHKRGSSIQDLGCSVDDFKQYIEKLWLPGMSWENYGRSGWHLDHVIPLASFDLTDLSQVRAACHYTNYQPLWASDNIRKSNK